MFHVQCIKMLSNFDKIATVFKNSDSRTCISTASLPFTLPFITCVHVNFNHFCRTGKYMNRAWRTK